MKYEYLIQIGDVEEGYGKDFRVKTTHDYETIHSAIDQVNERYGVHMLGFFDYHKNMEIPPKLFNVFGERFTQFLDALSNMYEEPLGHYTTEVEADFYIHLIFFAVRLIIEDFDYWILDNLDVLFSCGKGFSHLI